MDDLKVIRDTQHLPDTCPRCGASRSQLKASISELPYRPYNPWGPAFDRGPFETENHANTRVIMDNCLDCKLAIVAWQTKMEYVATHGMHIV